MLARWDSDLANYDADDTQARAEQATAARAANAVGLLKAVRSDLAAISLPLVLPDSTGPGLRS